VWEGCTYLDITPHTPTIYDNIATATRLMVDFARERGMHVKTL
jgi:hypothetical protein